MRRGAVLCASPTAQLDPLLALSVRHVFEMGWEEHVVHPMSKTYQHDEEWGVSSDAVPVFAWVCWHFLHALHAMPRGQAQGRPVRRRVLGVSAADLLRQAGRRHMPRLPRR